MSALSQLEMCDPAKKRHGKPNCEWAGNSKDSSYDLRGKAQSCQEYKEWRMTAAALTNPTLKASACLHGGKMDCLSSVILCSSKYFNNQFAKSTSSRARQFSLHFPNRRNKQVPGLLCISCPDISIPPRPLTKAQVVTAALRSLLVVE
ncbi:hypothetical protein QQF64_005550 [Cirrhinus molitorella]|uniref:BTB domain-containing protein n=1 Tax=Cirrhinus molitorella TaxID=172907 RepID=A0ABR3MEW0_9TELE